MSHPSHVEHLESARQAGFTTRLIFVATEDPGINQLRVVARVLHGGHDVPADRIEARYHRCLANLPSAIRAADHAMIFDNSRPERPFRLLAEIADGHLRHVDVARPSAAEIDPLDLPYWWLSAIAGFASSLISRDGSLP
jgi:predicted ABC-type ATPase